jgi:hypothetical protein
LSRAAGLAAEGVVHEWTGIEQYERPDSRRDTIARRAFGNLKRLLANHPALLASVERDERAYWVADEQADSTVTGHAVEGVELFEELGGLLGGIAPA